MFIILLHNFYSIKIHALYIILSRYTVYYLYKRAQSYEDTDRQNNSCTDMKLRFNGG